MTDPYRDMLHLPHHVSTSHPPMPREIRAAQFAPFAALTGYGEVLREERRLTQARRELGEDAREDVRRELNKLAERIPEHPRVRILWFTADTKKAGGFYRETSGPAKKLDLYRRHLELADGTRIPLDEIAEISLEAPET